MRSCYPYVLAIGATFPDVLVSRPCSNMPMRGITFAGAAAPTPDTEACLIIGISTSRTDCSISINTLTIKEGWQFYQKHLGLC